MANVVEIRDLYFTYPDGHKALNGISFSIEEASRVALLGPNGAGKSTLLLHLNGLNLPQQGTVKVLDKILNKKTEKWIRSMVGMVFQDPDDQVFSASVWDDVAFGPINMGLDDNDVSLRTEKALKAVGMLEFKEKPPYNLSYGQKKRVAIAGVLAMEPQVIILDEPMAFLDPAGKRQVVRILEDLNQRGITIIIATHDVDLAAEWADKLVILKNGQILAEGGSSLLTNTELVETASLRFPLVAQIFLGLPALNVEQVPLTVEQATKTLNSLIIKQK